MTTVTVCYKLVRWRWWVAPLLAVADWTHSPALAGWAVRLVLKRGRSVVVRP